MPHNFLRRIAGALVLLVITAAPAQALSPPRSGHPVFDRAVQLVMDNFYDTSRLDGFVDAVRREVDDSQAPVNAQSPTSRVDAAISTILDSLQASHTGRFRPDGIDYFELADIFRYGIRSEIRRLFPPDGDVTYEGIGMAARRGNGLWFVSDVYDGGPAARAGILAGDEILSVDGAPYREIESFRDKVGKTVDVIVRRRPDSEPISIEVAVERLRPLPTFEKAIESSARIEERDGHKIGYIHLWTLAAPHSMAKVGEALAEGRLKEAEGLVLDLRGRWGGGRSDAAELFLGGVPPFRLIGRDGKTMLATVRWNRPVVALIDEGTRSGLEVFAYALKSRGVPLVGSRTAGALLAGSAYVLPDDSLLELAVSDAVIGEDIRLEGRGVQPDISVPFTLPYAAGQDAQRDAAIEEMRRILARD